MWWRIFQRLPSPDCRWYLINGAGHGNLWAKGGETYTEAFLNFLEEQGDKNRLLAANGSGLFALR